MGKLADLAMGLSPRDEKRLAARVLDEADGHVPSAIAAARMLGVTAASNASKGRHICRVCGCWELGACESGCAWAEDDLCTACEPEAARLLPFPLMPKDPLAPFLVSIWSSIRMADFEAAAAKYARMIERAGVGFVFDPDVDAAIAAQSLAQRMFDWQAKQRQEVDHA